MFVHVFPHIYDSHKMSLASEEEKMNIAKAQVLCNDSNKKRSEPYNNVLQSASYYVRGWAGEKVLYFCKIHFIKLTRKVDSERWWTSTYRNLSRLFYILKLYTVHVNNERVPNTYIFWEIYCSCRYVFWNHRHLTLTCCSASKRAFFVPKRTIYYTWWNASSLKFRLMKNMTSSTQRPPPWKINSFFCISHMPGMVQTANCKKLKGLLA